MRLVVTFSLCTIQVYIYEFYKVKNARYKDIEPLLPLLLLALCELKNHLLIDIANFNIEGLKKKGNVFFLEKIKRLQHVPFFPEI